MRLILTFLFWSLLSACQQGPVVAAEPESITKDNQKVDPITVADLAHLITEQNDSSWRYSYIVTMKNSSSEHLHVDLAIRYYNSAGFLLHGSTMREVIPPGTHQFSDYDLIRPPLAMKIVKIEADVEDVRRYQGQIR